MDSHRPCAVGVPLTASRPTVSVCIPAHNAGETIAATIASIRRQSFSDYELIVLDNASTDATGAVSRLAGGDDIKVLRFNDLVSAEENIERAILAARGRYIAVYHADDLYHPEILKREVEFLDAHSEAGAVFCRSMWINSAGKPLKMGPLPPKFAAAGSEEMTYGFIEIFKELLRHYNFIVCPSALVRAEVYHTVPRRWKSREFDTSADLGIWLGILEQHRIGIIPEPLVHYRLSPGQDSARARHRNTRRADFFLVLDHYLARPEIAAQLSPSDFDALLLLEYRDICLRATNMLILGDQAAARDLLARSSKGVLRTLLRQAPPWRPNRFYKAAAWGAFLRLATAFPRMKFGGPSLGRLLDTFGLG